MEKNNLRYERKFFLSHLTKGEVESAIKLHPSIFHEIYYERRVNNIYLDSFDMVSYFDNVMGMDKRTKVRVRWYGNLLGDIHDPVLELKIKHGLLCEKKSFSLPDFKVDSTFSIDKLHDIFNKLDISAKLKLDLTSLDFALLNSYRRKYFLSADKKYRATIDSSLKFHKIAPFENNFLDTSIDHLSVILEVKYDKEHEPGVSKLTSYFPFRMTKSSKYIMGIERLNLMKTYSHV